MSTWFEQLFGFTELPYAETRARFEHSGQTLRSTENGREFVCGSFSTPSLAELRTAAAGLRKGTLVVHHDVIGDALELHAQADNEGALFQAASQLNCLEFADAKEAPEDGVTQYASDPTQGPACSLAAAAATVVRNYFVEVEGESGQTRERQLNNLDDLQAALGPAGAEIEVRHGYTFSDAERLTRLAQALEGHDREALMGAIKIGVHRDVGVTFASRFVEPERPQLVSQAFCSALSCGYNGGDKALWEPIARLVLDAAYEATMWAAIDDAENGRGTGKVWLTFLGGGAFGNETAWIAGAMSRAIELVRDRDLEVHIAHYRSLNSEIAAAIDRTLGIGPEANSDTIRPPAPPPTQEADGDETSAEETSADETSADDLLAAEALAAAEAMADDGDEPDTNPGIELPEQASDEQAPDEQAPDEQAPDERAPDEQAPDEQAHEQAPDEDAD